MDNAKILIIDDDPDLTQALRTTLESRQYIVVTAADRSEGMQKIKDDKPDLIILDVMMATWQDGFEMARELRADAQFKDMPILMLSAIKDRTGVGFKSSVGDPDWLPVDRFLDKPVEPDVLLAEVDKLLSERA